MNQNLHLRDFVRQLYEFNMIDRKTLKRNKNVQFVTNMYNSMINACDAPVSIEEVRNDIEHFVFEVHDFESSVDDFIIYDRKREEKKGDELYELMRHKRFYECKVNDDVLKLTDEAIEDIEFGCYIQTEPFKRLEAQRLDENMLRLKLYVHNEDHNCEEFVIKLKFWKVGEKKFKYVVLSTKRNN